MDDDEYSKAEAIVQEFGGEGGVGEAAQRQLEQLRDDGVSVRVFRYTQQDTQLYKFLIVQKAKQNQKISHSTVCKLMAWKKNTLVAKRTWKS